MPALFSKPVEVLGVSRAVEASSGKSIYQVVFGEMIPFTDATRPYFPVPQGTVPPRANGFNVLVLFFDASTPPPYKVGSKWVVEMGPDGAVNVRPEVP